MGLDRLARNLGLPADFRLAPFSRGIFAQQAQDLKLLHGPDVAVEKLSNIFGKPIQGWLPFDSVRIPPKRS
jgi:hypothetical protein